ncbi:MAG: hypothetical protein K1X55_16170 [Chitinophagales bacterium]|nr:hypothetical protein [Chitinophagales bacterium]
MSFFDGLFDVIKFICYLAILVFMVTIVFLSADQILKGSIISLILCMFFSLLFAFKMRGHNFKMVRINKFISPFLIIFILNFINYIDANISIFYLATISIMFITGFCLERKAA